MFGRGEMRVKASKKSVRAYATFEDLERQFGPMTLGRFIKVFRQGDEASQTAYAKRLGISKANLCDIEKERKLVGIDRAAKFARVLGLPEAALVQLAMQDQLNAAKIKLRVVVRAA